MSSGHPTRATPLGCAVILLGLLIPMPVALLCGYGLWKWFAAAPSARPERSLELLAGGLIGGLVLVTACFWIGMKILRNTDWKRFDREDPRSLM